MNKTQIKQIIDRGRVWDVANKHLYDLFKKNFEHDSDEKIIAKTWILGRTYSVALERRNKTVAKKNNSLVAKDNQDFYRTKIVEIFLNSKLDEYLKNLLKTKLFSEEAIILALKTHNYLTKQIKTISGQNRSFSSKYLHFHLPKYFFIYDSIASKNINTIIKKHKDYNDFKRKYAYKEEYDKTYYDFFIKCLFLKDKMNKNLTPRQIDDLLLYLNEEDLR